MPLAVFYNSDDLTPIRPRCLGASHHTFLPPSAFLSRGQIVRFANHNPRLAYTACRSASSLGSPVTEVPTRLVT